MKESSKFLIVIIIVAIFSIATVTIMGTAISQITQAIMPGNENSEMKNETFNSTTISVPVNSNFTEDSGVFRDDRNGIIIQVTNQSIPTNQLSAYAETLAEESNLTLINSTGLPNNTAAFKGTSNETIVIVVGESQSVTIMAINQNLAIKIAKSVNFNG